MNPLHAMYEPNSFDIEYLQLPPQPPQSPQPPQAKRIKKDRACDLCRRKKVKCNFDHSNPEMSCTSCRHYNKTCTFNEAAKKRGPPKGYVEKLENRLKRIESTLTNIAKSGNLPPELLNQVLDDQPSSSSSSKAKKKSGKQKAGATTTPDQYVVPENPKESLSYLGSSSGFYMLNKFFSQSSFPTFRDKQIFSQPLAEHDDDMMVVRFQHDSGPFTSQKKEPNWKPPPKELVNYLIKVYFTNLNNLLPIIDQDDFYASYRRGINQEQVPLIVSICRATCRSLKRDHPLLKKLDIDSIELFKDLTEQMADYFNPDFMKPDIQSIQSIMLYASNAEKWELESHHWILTSIAVKMAQDLGLHRSNTSNTESKKRLWWSIFCVDRWVCAALGRPLTISEADCDVEFPNTEGNKYSFFLQMVKLSCILGDVLRSICSPRSRIMSEKGIGLEQVSSNLELLLQEWKYSLPADLNLTDEELSRISRGESDPELIWKINNGGGRLFLCYYTILLIIKRPVLATLNRNVTLPPECQNAMDTLVHLFDMIDVTQLLCGWTLSSHCISQTQILLFLYHRSSTDTMYFQNSHYLEDLFKGLHQKLSEYIKERSIVPFLDALSKVLDKMGDSSETDGENLAQRASTISLHQTHLWNMSNNIEREEMIKLLAETGYQN